MGKAACSTLVCVAFLLLACGTRQLHPFHLDEAQMGAPGVKTVGLLPPNVFVTLPPELDAGADRVASRIREHARDCGREIVPFSVGEARSLWNEVAGEEAAELRGEEVDRALVARYVQKLDETRHFDVLVAPALVYRNADVRFSTQEAVWDGVRRELPVKGYHHAAGSTWGDTKLRGPISAVSLRVVAYDRSGARVFEGYGGLDLAHEWHYRTEWKYDRNMHRYPVPVYQVRLRDPRLADDALLREGVAMAFHPYLVSPTHPIEEAP